jgi:hypothetical protein
MRLLSEMKAPGDAILDFEIAAIGESLSELRLTSRFLPKGLSGILYWYGFFPLHRMVFRGLLTAIVHTANKALIQHPEPSVDLENDTCFLPKY